MPPESNGRPCLLADLRGVLLLAVLLVLPLTNAVQAQVCPSRQGDCLEAHGKPGCDDEACCLTVCGIDPFCCKNWDGSCAEEAALTCAGLCGTEASGSCFEPNGSGACDDVECCQAVCLVDSFCCETTWDTNCVILAGFSCDTGGGDCGASAAGSCSEPNGTPACDDEGCCEQVCIIDPRCCQVVWDILCATTAESVCSEGCVLEINPDMVLESEGCKVSENDPCDGGEPEAIGLSEVTAGSFQIGTDVDVYEIDLTDLDLDGDGMVRIRTTLVSSAFSQARISAAECDADVLLEIDGSGCLARIGDVCVPAGPTWVSVTAATEQFFCSDPVYLIEIEARDTCGEYCGTEGDCLVPRETPGCDDPICCDLICEMDPDCCHWEWDFSCASLAAAECGGPPPVNDECADAMPASIGVTPFRQLLSTLDGPEEGCTGDDPLGGDVWFEHLVSCDGLMVFSTCGLADFDTMIEIYRGDCDSLESIGCNNDDLACLAGSSLVQIGDAICGETLLIRVAGVDQATGNGSLAIECLGVPCPCPADLDGSGLVDGADFGLLLVSWGPCDGPCPADLDGDGLVGGSDLGIMLSAWGGC